MPREPTVWELVLIVRYEARLNRERWKANKRQLKAARRELVKWQAGANEFRAALSDARSNTMPRPEIYAKFDQMNDRLESHEKILNNLTGKSLGIGISRDTVISLVAIGVALYSVFHGK
jgi:hypothetical protein